MSATERHINKIKLIRKSLESGEETISEISESTGLHRITVKQRLLEAQAWGVAHVLSSGQWRLDK